MICRLKFAAPLTLDQVTAYAQVAGQNIVAFATGGTPSYVIPQLPDCNVNALVLSMQWGPAGVEGEPSTDASAESSGTAGSESLQQGNAVQVSFRPGIPLQSNLFQMCQHAGRMFVEKRFNGELKIGLTLGFDPAMHGYGRSPELSGVDTTNRAVIISESSTLWIHLQSESNGRTTQGPFAKRDLPVGSRDGAVHHRASGVDNATYGLHQFARAGCSRRSPAHHQQWQENFIRPKMPRTASNGRVVV